MIQQLFSYTAPLDARRLAVGAFAFVLLFLILVPACTACTNALGMHCPYL